MNKWRYLKRWISYTLNTTIRLFILGLRIRYLNTVFGMNIHPTVRISMKAKLDFSNPKGINIGEGTYLAFGSVVLTHDMSRLLSQDVFIGKNCFIGANAIILPGVVLGDSVVVGAGSVVTKSFGSNLMIAGNPAKVVKEGINTGKLGIISENS